MPICHSFLSLNVLTWVERPIFRWFRFCQFEWAETEEIIEILLWLLLCEHASISYFLYQSISSLNCHLKKCPIIAFWHFLTASFWRVRGRSQDFVFVVAFHADFVSKIFKIISIQKLRYLSWNGNYQMFYFTKNLLILFINFFQSLSRRSLRKIRKIWKRMNNFKNLDSLIIWNYLKK